MLEDAEHAARACAAVRATGLPFWVGVTCRLRADGALAAFDFPGTKLSAVLDALLPFEPDAVNVMHSPPSAIVPALHAVHAAGWRGIIGAYPTLEEEDLAGGGAERTAPEALAKAARDWVAAGARIVGGCCGTTPEHVRALRAALDAA